MSSQKHSLFSLAIFRPAQKLSHSAQLLIFGRNFLDSSSTVSRSSLRQPIVMYTFTAPLFRIFSKLCSIVSLSS